MVSQAARWARCGWKLTGGGPGRGGCGAASATTVSATAAAVAEVEVAGARTAHAPSCEAPGPRGPAPRRTPAEEARTLVARNRVAALATLSADGSPWGSLVLYAALGDGTPVLCLSTLAEHGRNVKRDPRASLVMARRTSPATRSTAGG